MSGRTLRTILGLLAAASVMVGGGLAQAKTIGSSFDPNIFSGFGTFFVPDPPSPCLNLGIGFHAVNPGSQGCSGVVLESASVSANDGGGTVSLSLPPPTPAANAVTGIVLNPAANPVVVGFNTNQIPIDVNTCTGDLCGFTWFIEWESGLPVAPECGQWNHCEYDDWNPLDGLNNQVLLFNQCEDGCQGPTLFSTATHVTFQNVPEPGSLGLLLGALGAGWLVRRRKLAA